MKNGKIEGLADAVLFLSKPHFEKLNIKQLTSEAVQDSDLPLFD
jgi:hypothetical protein